MTGSTATTTFDPGTFRNVLGHYPTGVVVVTGVAEDGERLAMVMGSFTSVSLDPPLVAFLPMRSSRSFAKLRACTSMCINVLTGDQEHIGRAIASRWEGKFDGLECFESPAGNPVLAGSLAWLDVELTNTVEAGDHWIALCRVLDMEVLNPVSPLIFFQGGYGSFVIPSLVARIDTETISAVQEAVVARPELERLAAEIGCEVCLLTAVNRDELASVASAVAPGLNPAEGLGSRIPMVPPIGDTYMFAQPVQIQENWLAKARDAGEDRLSAYRERLVRVREDGYAVSYLRSDNVAAYGSMSQASRLYARGNLTPAQERVIRADIATTDIDYAHRELDDDARYDVGSIVAPVRNGQGEVMLTLRAGQVPPQVSGREVRRWIERTRSAATRIEALLTREAPSTTTAPATAR
ncbi:MAG: flavin reductase [Actinomycetales bacterium]